MTATQRGARPRPPANPGAPDGSEKGRAGALVLRVWLEGPADDPQLRIRLVGRQDVTRDVEATASASTIEDALALIAGWLERFSASAPGDSCAAHGEPDR